MNMMPNGGTIKLYGDILLDSFIEIDGKNKYTIYIRDHLDYMFNEVIGIKFKNCNIINSTLRTSNIESCNLTNCNIQLLNETEIKKSILNNCKINGLYIGFINGDLEILNRNYVSDSIIVDCELHNCRTSEYIPYQLNNCIIYGGYYTCTGTFIDCTFYHSEVNTHEKINDVSLNITAFRAYASGSTFNNCKVSFGRFYNHNNAIMGSIPILPDKINVIIDPKDGSVFNSRVVYYACAFIRSDTTRDGVDRACFC
jgi:uncharacterized protein YjbI with pentapeptide repeats